jgi:hypothetical protein
VLAPRLSLRQAWPFASVLIRVLVSCRSFVPRSVIYELVVSGVRSLHILCICWLMPVTNYVSRELSLRVRVPRFILLAALLFVSVRVLEPCRSLGADLPLASCQLEYLCPVILFTSCSVWVLVPHHCLCALAICTSATLSGDLAKFITALDVERTLREIASKVYKLDPIKDKAALQC